MWDEARALAAIGGSRASLQALRKLFLDELPTLHQQVIDARAADDVQSMQAVLHKLKAGCGFVGAARLAQDGGCLVAGSDGCRCLAPLRLCGQRCARRGSSFRTEGVA